MKLYGTLVLVAMLLVFSVPPARVAAQQGTITGAGSTFVNPLMSKWSKEYNTLHPDIKINYQSLGSGAGRQQFIAKTVAFGASDAPLTDDQLAQAGGGAAVVHIPVTHGSVVMAYNLPEVTTQMRFSPATIAGIYLGTITTWDDPKIKADNPGTKLPGRPVLVVHRSEGSGTTDIFTDYLSKVSPEWKSKVGRGSSVQWPTGIGGQGNEGVANQIRNTVGGLGYIELAYARQNKIAYGSVKNRAGNYVDPDPKNVTNAAASLNAPADLRFSITDQPGPQAYPSPARRGSCCIGRRLTPLRVNWSRRSSEWAIHDGQRYGTELDYAALSPNLVQKADAALRSLTCGGQPCIQK